MASELCGECEEPMVLIERASGEKLLSCHLCGWSKSNEDELVHIAEGEPSTFCFSGQGAKPQGYKYEKYRPSIAKKKAKDALSLLCQQLNTPIRFQKDMEALMDLAQVKRQQKAIAGGIFLAYMRDHQEQDSSMNIPTLRQVSIILGTPMSKIATALKQLQGLLEANSYRKSSGAITNIDSLVKTVLPEIVLSDPFVPEVDITDRVLSLAGKIIALVQRKSTHSLEPNLVTIAAHFLAWQSCFYYQKAHHSHIPMDRLKKPGSLPSLEKHLELLKLDRRMLDPIRRCHSHIVNELVELLEKMPWVVKKPRVALKNQVAEHLESILDFQEVVCDVLSQEAETKRQNEIHLQPTIPRELTTEEVAALEAPELSEKDLPDSELKNYLRSSKEVESLKQLVESEDSDAEN